MAGTGAAVYTGAFDSNGKWSGPGTLAYTTGVTYVGGFADGEFHGEGELRYPSGAVYGSVWRQGVEVASTSAYTWADGLPYNLSQPWDYLAGFDRRLWHEHNGGVRAAVPFPRATVRVQTPRLAAQRGASDADVRAAVLQIVRTSTKRQAGAVRF
jgi:hypothetical protein